MAVLMRRQRGPGGGKGVVFQRSLSLLLAFCFSVLRAFPCQPLPPSGVPPKLGIVQKFMSVPLKNWHLNLELRVSSWPPTHLNF